MTPMSQTRIPEATLDAALRALDAAPPTPLDDTTQVRTTAALEQTLAAGRFPQTRTTGPRDSLVPRPRRTGARVALLGAAAAAVAVGIGATQVLGGSATAYAASWTPVPTAASAADVAAAQDACADTARRVAGQGASRLQPRLAERRGDLVLLAMDDGAAEPATVMCVAALPATGGADVLSASGGGGAVRPASDGVTDAGVFQRSTPGDELSVIDGLAGEDVKAVTVHTADGLTVQATVAGGHYAAWWPGRAMSQSNQPLPSGVQGGCAGECDGGQPLPDYTLDVTLTDGTVLSGMLPGVTPSAA